MLEHVLAPPNKFQRERTLKRSDLASIVCNDSVKLLSDIEECNAPQDSHALRRVADRIVEAARIRKMVCLTRFPDDLYH
jgi:hypothetical protein